MAKGLTPPADAQTLDPNERNSMSTAPKPTEHSPIDETRGRQSRCLLLSVDGLCVALADQQQDFPSIAADLVIVMSGLGSPSGLVLLEQDHRPNLSETYRRELANLGISIERSSSADQVADAKRILADFIRRSRVQQARYEEAGKRSQVR